MKNRAEKVPTIRTHDTAESVPAVFLRTVPPRTDAKAFMRQYAHRTGMMYCGDWPVLCFSSQDALTQFLRDASPCFIVNEGYGTNPALFEVASRFDKAFFEENRLAVFYIKATSGSVKYAVSALHKTETAVYILLKCGTLVIGTCDIAHWIAFVAVPRQIAGTGALVGIQFLSGPSLGIRRITKLTP